MKNTKWLIFAALIMLFPAFYSRYPLVYSDSGTYLVSSIDLVTPTDRTLGYGLFVRIFSWQFTLWPVIFAQALLVLVCIWDTLIFFIKPKEFKYQYFYLSIVTIVLALFSSLPWYVSQIMPDIFIGVGALSLALLLVKEKSETSLIKNIFYGSLLFLSASVHVSHVVILSIVMIVFVIHFKKSVFLRSNKVKLISTGIIFILSVILFSVFNFKDHRQFKLSVSSHVFLLGRFAESGILQKYINAKCGSNEKIKCICTLANSPTKAGDIIWASDGFMKQFNYDFIKADPFAKYIVNDILLDPDYLFPFIYDCSVNSIKQMFQLNIASGIGPYGEGSAPSYPIFIHFEFEKNYFLNSEQSFNALNFKTFNLLNYFALCSCVLILAYFFIIKGLSKVENKFLFILVATFIVNSIVTASLANVYDRLQARITWPLVFFSMVLVIKEIIEKRSKTLE